MLEQYLDLRCPEEKALTDYKIKNPLSEAEYVTLAAIVRTLKPIQLDSEELCSRDVTLFSTEGVFSFIIEELHWQISAFSLTFKKPIDV